MKLDEPGSRKLDSGAKARQRPDTENRSIQFSDALRNKFIPATDVDFVVTNGRDVIRLVLEVTRPNETVYSEEAYLDSIDARRKDTSQGNNNDAIIARICHMLGVEGALVVFEPSICVNDQVNDESPVWFRNIHGGRWYRETAKEFLARVHRYALGK